MAQKIFQCSGKRKKSIARATIKAGKGIVRVNSQPLELIEPRYKQLRIKEALILAGDLAKNKGALLSKPFMM